MASDKIVNKILQSANDEAQETINKANEQAETERKNIEDDTAKRLQALKKQFETDSDNVERRAELNAGLEERKNLLAAKRRVMDEAFKLARERMRSLPEKTWEEFIIRICLAGTDTDTEYIKVPEKDMKRYTTSVNGKRTLLEQINSRLAQIGHRTPLKLDEHPARFEDGLMLIGRYSDVNASFDVLIENMREGLEWDVTQILFGKEQ